MLTIWIAGFLTYRLVVTFSQPGNPEARWSHRLLLMAGLLVDVGWVLLLILSLPRWPL